ncbi:phage integrase [Paraburkholderia fungorum]|uniref:phage integrase n=1 Tax=Paraburkholderia fungorum TaxID=134537 RepID=UPI001C1E9A4E|nr:tyrosine-type recombinase/integrase [Paraburkholderia fungorum]MBU7437009.1 tyrosine-type recombinase/integrase [Paraburkholderia fungorum]
MAIKKTKAGWTVDSQPGGRGAKCFRKSFETQAEAKRYEAWLATQVTANAAWEPAKRDLRKLSELMNLWYTHHGSGLRAGEDTHRRLLAVAYAIGDPPVDQFSVDMFAQYRTKRLSEGVTANNLNREHAYLRAAFNELARLGYWKKDNPLGKLRQFKIQENELSFLTDDQIRALLASFSDARNPHVALITRVCLATGARWSEAEELKVGQVRNGVIQFARTKSGKTRAVPIDETIELSLINHHKKHGAHDRIFGYAWSAFREAIERAGIVLPEGQMTHALRHTFASHFMMRGGNILALQRILGHQSLTMTMRYAHLAPEHLMEARLYNPLKTIGENDV